MATPGDFLAAPGPTSNISLVATSQTFVDNRNTTLGPWVIGVYIDSVLLGVILCQVAHFFKTRPASNGRGLQYWYLWLVVLVTGLTLLKSAQAMAVVFIQNVTYFMNPDVAKTLVAKAWWQVSVPLLTAITGAVVQSFFAFRFWMLTRNWLLTIPILIAMLLGVAGSALTVMSIVDGNVKAKVMWLLVNLICVFLADLMITVGTYIALRRSATGFSGTISLVNRLTRMVWESALPPTILATMDLILTQTLGTKLLWHLVLNYPLSKVYVISLLYTLNCTNNYRRERDVSTRSRSQDLYSYKDPHINKRGDVELGSRNIGSDGIRVHTQISTHRDGGSLSPMSKSAASPIDVHELKYHPDYIKTDHSEEELYEKRPTGSAF